MTESSNRFAWLPRLNYQIWILSLGRLLSQTGSGFTLFYAPIFFVNQVGLSATQVGIGLGSASISGVIGRVLGGSFADSPTWGRRRTLLLSAIVSAIASFVLAAADQFSVFVLGNLLMGFGIGLYWPPMEAMVADLVESSLQRSEAFAVARLSDSLGLGLGVVLGGLLVGTTGAYRALFVIDGISFLVLFGIVYWAIVETHKATKSHEAIKGWKRALRDRRLLTYALVNIIFTTYLVQVSSTLPLYLTNFAQVGADRRGLSPELLSALFTWHMALSVVTQISIARQLNRLSRAHALMLSALLWFLGFLCVWVTGIVTSGALFWSGLSLGILALATVTYMPSASSITVELAPDELRGVYLAVNSQCWAIGYFIGPPLGGWALDQADWIAHSFWIGTAFSALLAILGLQVLQRMMQTQSIQRRLS